MRADTETCFNWNLQYNTTHTAPYKVTVLKMRKGKQMKRNHFLNAGLFSSRLTLFFYAAGCLKSILVYKDWNKNRRRENPSKYKQINTEVFHFTLTQTKPTPGSHAIEKERYICFAFRGKVLCATALTSHVCIFKGHCLRKWSIVWSTAIFSCMRIKKNNAMVNAEVIVSAPVHISKQGQSLL